MGHADRFRYPGLQTTIEVACPAGHPRVLRCHPLHRAPTPDATKPGITQEPAADRVDAGKNNFSDQDRNETPDSGVPFPTLFWLACDDIVRAISALEHRGLITEIERMIAEDPALRERVHGDHQSYIDERWEALSPQEISHIETRGFDEKLRACGVGGIRNFDAVKCLHLHYAHHLARGSAIGALIHERLPADVCRGARDSNPS